MATAGSITIEILARTKGATETYQIGTLDVPISVTLKNGKLNAALATPLSEAFAEAFAGMSAQLDGHRTVGIIKKNKEN